MVLIGYILILRKFFFKKRQNKYSQEEKITGSYENTFGKVANAIIQDTITDKNELRLIFDQSEDVPSMTYNDFLAKLEYWLLLESTKHQLEKEDTIKVKNFITPILNEEIEIRPYDGISDNDRAALASIEMMVENHNKKDDIKKHLISVSNSLKRYQKRIEDQASINRLAVYASIASVGITLFLYIFGRSSISFKDLNYINHHTDKQIELAIDSIKSAVTPEIKETN
jgi:hypothetical protein